MKRRLTALLLALTMLLGMFPGMAYAASSVEEALGEVDIYHSGEKMSYLSINGRVREQTFTYYNHTSLDGSVQQIPAYCVNPNTAGVPQTVPAGTSIKYLADEKSTDPRVFGIVASGYPHKSLEELGLNNINEAKSVSPILPLELMSLTKSRPRTADMSSTLPPPMWSSVRAAIPKL